MSRRGILPNYFRNRAKRILYTLRRDTNCYLYDLAFNEGDVGRHKARMILQRLIKKGLVDIKKVPLRANNSYSVRAYYWLTDEGKKVADEIVKEIDEYKSW